MPPLPSCERCGGPKRGCGQGYCINAECRKAAKEEKEQTKKEERSRHGAGSRGPQPAQNSRRKKKEALQEERVEIGAGSRGPQPAQNSRRKKKEALQEERVEIGAGSRGPQPAQNSRRKKKEALQEEREEIGAGSRGPKPGEGSGGRPAVPEAARRGPPCVGADDFDAEQVRRSYRHFLRGWSKFGLSRVCQACGTLTPAKHCKEAKGTGQLRCRNCREGRTNYTLPTLPPIPAALQSLTNIERRLLAMAKWDQVIIDKLPSGDPSAQWGRMYTVLMGEPAICNAFEDADLGEDGTVYVKGVQGMTASSARLGQLYAALQALKDGHFSYMRNPAVVETLEIMQGVLEQLATTTMQPAK